MPSKITETELKERIKDTHGDKYILANIDYTSGNLSSPIELVCREHGSFRISAKIAYTNGEKCPICQKEKPKSTRRLNQQDAIDRFLDVWGETYDYSTVEYTTMKNKVCVICKVHGEFWVTPSNHLYGKGCPTCGKLKSTHSITKSQESFVDQAIAAHGEKLDFHKTVYNGAREHVIVTCPTHGDYKVVPHALLSGSGCQKCHTENKRIAAQEYMCRARIIHGDTYRYSTSPIHYESGRALISATCPIHGKFTRRIDAFLNGYGCTTCLNENNRSSGESIVYNALLNQHNVLFEEQVNLITGTRYLFDFVLYANSYPIGIIEYHGGHHYTPTTWVSNVSEKQAIDIFDRITYRDYAKSQWSRSNGIPLCVVPYQIKVEEVRDIVSNFIESVVKGDCELCDDKIYFVPSPASAVFTESINTLKNLHKKYRK